MKLDGVLGYCRDSRCGTVILSPHSDDAAFSVGGLLMGNLLPKPVTIITVFGVSNYANGQFHRDWRTISCLRHAEDIRFANVVGANLETLEFPEAGVRVAPSFDVLFVIDGVASEPALTASLQQELHTRLAALRPAVVLAPLGLGQHRDHIAVRVAAREPAESLKALLLYYEDLPYADTMTQDVIRDKALSVLANDAGFLTFFLREKLLQRQLEAIDVYHSQVDIDVRDAICRYSQRYEPCHGGQRLWGRRIDLTAFADPS